MNTKNLFIQIIGLVVMIALLVACGTTQSVSTPITPTPTNTSIPPTDTPPPPTATSVPPTATPIPPTNMPLPTATPEPTSTPTPRPYPSARGIPHMAYDTESQRVILYGGELYYAAPDEINDTWAYETSTNTWTQMTAPRVNGFGALVYDNKFDRMVFYRATDPKTYKPYGQILKYDFNTDTWTNEEKTEAPLGYYLAPMVFDTESERMVLFGGMTVVPWGSDGANHYTDETWAYYPDANEWIKMNPESIPSKRFAQAMAYHPTLDRVVLFGGLGYSGFSDETWLYDYNADSWEMIEPSESPRGRAYSNMVYVDSLDRIILFGGSHPIESSGNDMWMFDHENNTWVELKPTASPSKRAWHAMAYDAMADKIVIFGGGPDWFHYTNETWIYDPQANTWTDMTPGESGLFSSMSF